MATQNTRTLARLMMAPSVGLLLIWMIVPLAMTLWFSFQNYNLLNPANVSFAGLFNYHCHWVSLVHQPQFSVGLIHCWWIQEYSTLQ